MMKNLLFLLCTLFLITTSCKRQPYSSSVKSADVKTGTVNVTNTDGNTTGSESEVSISSPVNNILYYKCANNFTVEMPKSWKDIKVTASSAKIIKSVSDDQKYTVMPEAKTCELKVHAVKADGSQYDWNKKFNVIMPPMPTFKMTVNGREYNGVSPISKKSRILVKVDPNPDFAALFPEDAKYGIASVDLFAQRSLGAPTKIGTVMGQNPIGNGIPVRLGVKTKQDPPGTLVYLKINELSRITFQGDRVPVNLPEQMLYLSTVIK
jgi:hypothetical protein